MACPCCGAGVEKPPLEIIMTNCGIRENSHQGRALRAVWNGKGHAVSSSQIFDAIWHDDPDGGPAPNIMYEALKHTIYHLRQKLKGSGIDLIHAGYGQGYRLQIKGAKK